jgi:N-acetylglucosaminyl-diphospho-decaprenol L-rhamnosyltransferase
VDAVVGAYMQVRREALAQVGLLDETYWMYGEDLDWAFALHQAGWEVRYNPAVTVLHVKRAASRMSRRAQIAFQEAMLYFYRKHYAATTPAWLGGLVETSFWLNLRWTKLRERFRRRPQPASQP